MVKTTAKRKLSVKQKAKIVAGILRGKGKFFIGTSQSGSDFQRIVIHFSDLHFHRSDIEDIESKADLELSWMKFWYDPNWQKMEPKWFGKDHNGKFMEFMFVKDIRKPIPLHRTKRRGSR